MQRLFFVWITLMIAAGSLVAQQSVRGEASPISPELKLFDNLGATVGVPLLVQQGEYRDTCNCPPFTGGSGSGITLGLLYELPAERGQLFRVGISAGVDYRSLLAQYREQELLTFTSSDGAQQYRNVPVEFRQQSHFRTVGIWGQPYVRVLPFASDALALSVGVQGGVLFSGNVEHTKSLVQNTVRLPNGEILALEMAGGGSSTVIRSGEILGLARIQAAAIVRLETSIDIDSQWHVRPGIQYAGPLTTLSSSGTMKVTAWMFMLSLVRQSER
jgi:hypothetical protein